MERKSEMTMSLLCLSNCFLSFSFTRTGLDNTVLQQLQTHADSQSFLTNNTSLIITPYNYTSYIKAKYLPYIDTIIKRHLPYSDKPTLTIVSNYYGIFIYVHLFTYLSHELIYDYIQIGHK